MTCFGSKASSGFCRLSFLLVALALSPPGSKGQAGSTGQDQEKPVVKANTRLVVVDVVALDGKGAPVPDLGVSNFTLLEDGRPQKITTFNFQHPGTVEAAVHLPPNVFTNVPQLKPTSLNVILLDVLNGEFASHAFARDQLLKYLETTPEIQPTAVFVLDGRLKMLHDFTTDPKALREATAVYKLEGAPRVNTVDAAASPFMQKGDMQTSPQNIQTTLGALNAMALALAGYPGRKNLIWLSEAFPVNLYPENFMPSAQAAFAAHAPEGNSRVSGSGVDSSVASLNQARSENPTSPVPDEGTTSKSYNDYLAMIQRVADALMNAQVAVYPIDAAGVGKISRVYALTTMRSMAERTGGKTFANQNELLGSIRSSLNDGSTYYTLAYYPDNKGWDGKFRQILIKTDRPAVTLRYRLGYYALAPGGEADKKGAKRLSGDFNQAMALGSPASTAVLFQATVLPPSPKEPKVTISFAIDPHTLTFDEKEGGVEHADISCAAIAFSEKGSLVKDETTNLAATIRPAEFPKLMNTTFPCTGALDLKPGKYTLRLGVLDRLSHLIGTTTASVTVP